MNQNRDDQKKKRAIFLDRDGVINVEKTFVLSPGEMELMFGAGEALRKINESEYLAVVVTNQSAVARAYITLEELEAIHREMRRQLERAGGHLDGLYFCPHRERLNDDQGDPQFVKDCDCRKPKPGLLFQAARELNIDLKQSFMIGDSGRDIEAGKNAGCTTIGVRTGHGLKGLTQPPDYIFDHVKGAVDYILGDT